MALVAGTRLGPYEIVAPIGAGGMGEVYRAHDLRLGRDVAIKTADAHFSERFEREVRAIAALNHPHICQIYDVGPNYLVMELIDGRPLTGPLPLDQALKYAAQIAGALDAAHRKGIAHRDLKPANILVTRSGIKLLDFGLAKTGVTPIKNARATEETVTKVLTGRNEIVGTLHYMSPEQLQPGVREVDARTDIFSFGLVLYEMLTGQRAFDGPSPASVIAAILERPAPSVGTVAPPALDRVLQRCLAKDVDDRWQTARDLHAELDWIAAAPVEPLASAPTQSTRRWLPLAAVGILAMAGLAAGSWLRGPAPAPLPRLQVSLETPTGEDWILPVFSPDATKVAFGTNTGIRVRTLDSLDSQLIAKRSSGAASILTWSPDSRFLAYYDGASAGELRRVPVTGGAPQTIVAGLPNFRGAAWNTDGTILYSYPSAPIMRVSENGGTPVKVTSENGLHPTMLPDHRHFLFLGGKRFSEDTIYLGSLDSKEIRPITPANSQAEFAPSGHLLFLRGVTLMAQPFNLATLRTTGDAFPLVSDVRLVSPSRSAAFSVASNGLVVYQGGGIGRDALTWFDRSGKPMGVVDDANPYSDIDLSPDGSKIGAARIDPKTLGSSVWVTDLKRGITSRLTPETDTSQPLWSPDGKRIAYRAGSRICVRDAVESGSPELLPSVEGSDSWHAWSPDGRMLAIGRALDGAGLSLIPLGGDHQPASRFEGQFRQPAFSPDGHWIAYVSNESGSYEVFVQSMPIGHGKWQISAHGGAQPIWRRDGKELFYKSADNQIVAVPVKIGVTFEAGLPKELFHVNSHGLNYVWHHYAVSSDGQRFLVIQAVDEHVRTILLQDWLNLRR
jgi:serine/threonine protein kinase